MERRWTERRTNVQWTTPRPSGLQPRPKYRASQAAAEEGWSRVSTAEQLAGEIERLQPELAGDERGLQGLAGEARSQLARWGHEEHVLTLERVDRGPGSGALRCWFWCESCHVSQLLVLDEPGVR